MGYGPYRRNRRPHLWQFYVEKTAAYCPFLNVRNVELLKQNTLNNVVE